MKESYIPARNDIVWLDFEPTKGKEIGDSNVILENSKSKADYNGRG